MKHMIVCDERMYQNIKPGGTAGENTLVPADWDRSFFMHMDVQRNDFIDTIE